MPDQPSSVPLRLGAPEQFAALRSALIQLRYDEPSVCERLGIASIYEFLTEWDSRPTGGAARDGLDALIHLLIFGETLSRENLEALLPATVLAAFEELGVLAEVPGRPALYSTVFLHPVENLFIASDRRLTVDGARAPLTSDYVFSVITWNTMQFVQALPHWPANNLLDLCSGAGIAAFLGAARAKHVWACDLTPRSVAFAEFNRRFNGLDNVTVACGDLFDPVGDRKFDVIVAHPPYVPARSQEVIFRDGGEDGEQVLRRIVEGLPGYLEPGGRFYAFTLGTDREGETFEQRVRRWLGEKQDEFDLSLIVFEIAQTPDAIIRAVLEWKGRFDNYAPHAEMFQRLKVSALHIGALVLSRVKAPRRVVTARTRKAGRAGHEAIEWFERWNTAAAEPSFDELLLQSRPRLSPWFKLQVTHMVDGQRLVPAEFELKTEYPFSIAAPCPGWIAVMVGACNGSQTAAELFESLKRQGSLNASMTTQQFTDNLRHMIARGFVEIEEFPLPSPAH